MTEPEKSKGGWLWLALLLATSAILAVFFAQPLKTLETFINDNWTSWLYVTVGLAALGGVFFVGGAVYGLITQGKPMSQEELEQFHDSSTTTVSGPSLVAGRQVAGERSIREFKDLLRSGAWRRDPQGRWFIPMACGGLLLMFASWGLALGLFEGGWVKALLTFSMLYVLVRLSWTFWKA